MTGGIFWAARGNGCGGGGFLSFCEGPVGFVGISLAGAAASLIPFIVAIVLAGVDAGKPPTPVQAVARALLPRMQLPVTGGAASVTPLVLALPF
jgi:hypothetical protein